jgi:hypothetical protein
MVRHLVHRVTVYFVPLRSTFSFTRFLFQFFSFSWVIVSRTRLHLLKARARTPGIPKNLCHIKLHRGHHDRNKRIMLEQGGEIREVLHLWVPVWHP